MSLAKPQSPGCKLPSFPAHWICGSYSPSWAAPTKSALLSSTVAIFRSRSGAICLYDLCWENGLWKTGHSKFLRLSSFDLQLPSSQVSQGHFFLKKALTRQGTLHLPVHLGKLGAWYTFHNNTEKRVTWVSLVFT